MLTTDRDQKLVVLVTASDARLVATQGDCAHWKGHKAVRLAANGYHTCLKLPTDPGFHVWEGDIEHYSGISGPGEIDPRDPETAWRGKFRPATPADLAVFGIPLPAETAK